MKSSLECLNKLKEDYAASAVSLAGETEGFEKILCKKYIILLRQVYYITWASILCYFVK